MSMHHEFIKTEGSKHTIIFPNKTELVKNYCYQTFRKITEEKKGMEIIHVYNL